MSDPMNETGRLKGELAELEQQLKIERAAVCTMIEESNQQQAQLTALRAEIAGFPHVADLATAMITTADENVKLNAQLTELREERERREAWIAELREAFDHEETAAAELFHANEKQAEQLAELDCALSTRELELRELCQHYDALKAKYEALREATLDVLREGIEEHREKLKRVLLGKELDR